MGSWVDHNARVVLITPTQITFLEKNNGTFYSIRKTKHDKYYPPLSEQLKHGEWKRYTYNYEKLFMLNTNDIWYTEKDYMKPVGSSGIMYDELFRNYEVYYILIKLDAKRYVSLGYQPFEFEIPDEDEIIDLTGDGSKSGNQNIKLFGRKNTYVLNDGGYDIQCSYYIPNDFIKNHKHFDIWRDIWKDEKGLYVKIWNWDKKKILGVKIPHWKDERLYDVAHYLESKDINLSINQS